MGGEFNGSGRTSDWRVLRIRMIRSHYGTAHTKGLGVKKILGSSMEYSAGYHFVPPLEYFAVVEMDVAGAGLQLFYCFYFTLRPVC
jgi:hypothetical protein